MSENNNLRVQWEPRFGQAPTLVVGWSVDVARLGAGVIDYLKLKLGMKEFAGIEPADYFPLTGVSIEGDVAQFPESKFYCSQEHNLVAFESSPAMSRWHDFLNTVLDVAQVRCGVKEFYTMGGMISFGAHTAPRQLMAVANSAEMRSALDGYDLSREMDYETPPGQRPTLSSYLLWVARKRNATGASLWTPVPFYLAANEDPAACKRVLGFLDDRMKLGLDFTDLDAQVAAQAEKLAELRKNLPQIGDSLSKLESNRVLTQEENESLVKEVERSLRKRS